MERERRIKRRKDDDGENEENAPIILGKVAKSIEPDFVVEVGGKTFLHYSLVLALNSSYFDRMLSHDMSERNKRRVNFVDHTADEWIEIYKFIDPETKQTAKVNGANALTLVSFFHKLEMNARVEECDGIIARVYSLPDDLGDHSRTKKLRISSGRLKHCVDFLHLGNIFGLKKTVSSFLHLMINEVCSCAAEWTNDEAEMVKVVLKQSGQNHWKAFCEAGLLPDEWAMKSRDEQNVLLESVTFFDLIKSRAEYIKLKNSVISDCGSHSMGVLQGCSKHSSSSSTSDESSSEEEESDD